MTKNIVKDQFAVFQKCGESFEQETIFVTEKLAKEYVVRYRERNPEDTFYVLKKMDY